VQSFPPLQSLFYADGNEWASFGSPIMTPETVFL